MCDSWWQRYQEHSEAGLHSLSRRPYQSPKLKVFEQEEQRILELRRTRHLGARRIQHELKYLHNYEVGLATIQKVLQLKLISPLKRRRKQHTRYVRPILDDRVQMDTYKRAPVYTAAGDDPQKRRVSVPVG